uniref:Uncharacterized protein n=1 Tax=Amphimedon queenslandica TaxID=400682 RepID=A0A1X7VBE9_AMPQE
MPEHIIQGNVTASKAKQELLIKLVKNYKLAHLKQLHALNLGYTLQKCKNWYNKKRIVMFKNLLIIQRNVLI